MNTVTALAQDFLQQKRIAIVGVSAKKSTPANGIYKRLKNLKYDVFPVNPRLDTFENDTCYHDLKSIPLPVDGVFLVTHPSHSEEIVQQCIELKIPRVWMHCMSGTKHNPSKEHSPRTSTSVSEKAVQLCRENDIAVIPGACPMMYCTPVDPFHRFVRWFLSITGKLHIG